MATSKANEMTPAEYGRWLAQQMKPATKAELEAAARIIVGSPRP